MLHIVFSPGWDKDLDRIMGPSWRHLHQRLLQNQQSIATCVQWVASIALRVFERDHSLRGLCAYLEGGGQELNPFLVTRHFCIKVLGQQEGQLILNISPVYHLNLDYPEMYQQQYGKVLDPLAVIGLIQLAGDQTQQLDGALFRYGIDLGVAFAKSNVPHNHVAHLTLRVGESQIEAVLECLGNVSMQVIPITHIESIVRSEQDPFWCTQSNNDCSQRLMVEDH